MHFNSCASNTLKAISKEFEFIKNNNLDFFKYLRACWNEDVHFYGITEVA